MTIRRMTLVFSLAMAFGACGTDGDYDKNDDDPDVLTPAQLADQSNVNTDVSASIAAIQLRWDSVERSDGTLVEIPRPIVLFKDGRASLDTKVLLSSKDQDVFFKENPMNLSEWRPSADGQTTEYKHENGSWTELASDKSFPALEAGQTLDRLYLGESAGAPLRFFADGRFIEGTLTGMYKISGYELRLSYDENGGQSEGPVKTLSIVTDPEDLSSIWIDNQLFYNH